MATMSASPKAIIKIATDLLERTGDKSNRTVFLEMDRRNDILRILHLATVAEEYEQTLYLAFEDLVVLGMIVDFILGGDFDYLVP